MIGFKSGIKFGFGFAIACIFVVYLLAFLTSFPELLAKYDDASASETWQPEIEIVELNHWSTQDKVVFVGSLENKSSHQWKSIAVHFKVRDADQNYLSTCTDVLYKPSFDTAEITFEAKCTDMPNKLEAYTFEKSFFGRF